MGNQVFVPPKVGGNSRTDHRKHHRGGRKRHHHKEFDTPKNNRCSTPSTAYGIILSLTSAIITVLVISNIVLWLYSKQIKEQVQDIQNIQSQQER